jgi:hypothetical protein
LLLGVRTSLCDRGIPHASHGAGKVPVGTLEVRNDMIGVNLRILLVHAKAAGQQPLTAEAEQALHQFLVACNDGTVELNRDAVLPLSARMELLTDTLKVQSIDYPTWERAFFNLGPQYFDLHAHVTGRDLIEHYRAALVLHVGAKDTLYQLALCAVEQCRGSIATHDNTRCDKWLLT